MDELEKIPPQLSKIKKGNPFGTPDRYFDDFSARLQIKLEAEKESVPTQQGRIIRFLKPAIGLAASFALIFMLVYWPLKTFTTDQVAENNLQNSIDESEITNIFVDKIDDNSFFALLDEPAMSVEFTDDDLISYLTSNVSEYEIYNETGN